MTESMLESVQLFAGLDPEARGEVVAAFRQRAVPAGQLLFEEGDAPDAFYVVIAGQVEIVKRGARGGDGVRVALLGPGDYFGEMGLIEDEPRLASARVVQRAELFVAAREPFRGLMESCPEIERRIRSEIARRHFENIRGMMRGE